MITAAAAAAPPPPRTPAAVTTEDTAPPMAALWAIANRLPAATLPIPACRPAAIEPATGPAALKPITPRPAVRMTGAKNAPAVAPVAPRATAVKTRWNKSVEHELLQRARAPMWHGTHYPL
ncbi:hypothetical protein BC827DRAFT_1232513 [Russula dissimulans]|nr:hypothetical protein BC827DRAFT_1232513 [Russula dissimulans]